MNFLRISQFLTWPIAFFYFNFVYKLEIKGKENFNKVESPFIIIANHFSFTDSFLFRLVLGPFTPHLPLRFMAVEKFNWSFLNFLADIGVIDFIYGIFGVFVVVPGRGLSKNLEEAKEIISKKGNIVIYPEGNIVITDKISQFRIGAATLAVETGTTVMPVSFRPGPFQVFNRNLWVNVGTPIKPLPGQSIDDFNNTLHDAVEKLYSGQA